jgi:NADPH:quinone reductase-like Zn-dependent oxidoreductase
MSPPAQKIRALTVLTGGGAAVTLVPPPLPRADALLVRPRAVGLNPTDWKSAEGGSRFGRDPAGCRLGCDYVGVVEQVGEAVSKGKGFAPGTRVAGFVHGGNQVCGEDGAFAELIVVKGDLQIVVPDNISDAEAATLGVGITTVVSSSSLSL